MIINIYLLPNMNLILLKKTNYYYIYIYSTEHFLIIPFLAQNNDINYNKELNYLKIKYNYYCPVIYTNWINNQINNFLFSWNIFFYKKIKFTGKGFKIIKIKERIFFFFNRSNLTCIYYANSIVKKIKKSKLLFFFKNPYKYNYLLKKILNFRQINLFTKRGLRFSRQFVYKRKGKSSIQSF